MAQCKAYEKTVTAQRLNRAGASKIQYAVGDRVKFYLPPSQAQARLAAVLCGPMVVWFVLAAAMGLEMLGDPAAPLPESIMPIVLWGMPALSGVMGWNMDDAAPAAEA